MAKNGKKNGKKTKKRIIIIGLAGLVLATLALVLFLFTFVVNTGAELIRQRLREKYSSL